MAPQAPHSELRINYGGVSTLSFQYEGNTILLDGFFSRPPPTKVAAGLVVSDLRAVKDGLKRLGVNTATALLVSHTHYDHALDAANVADETNTTVYGSNSLKQLMLARASGRPMHVVSDRQEIAMPPFTVTFYKTPHAPTFFRYDGTISDTIPEAARVSEYKLGDNFSFWIRTPRQAVLVVPSAHYEVGALRCVEADVVFLSIALLGRQNREFAEKYWFETVRAVKAKLVVPIHWDNPTTPLNHAVRYNPALIDNIPQALEWILQFADRDGISVQFIPAFTPMRLSGSQLRVIQ